MSKKVTRLFRHFQPENYKLDLILFKETLKFSGKVIIKGKKVGRPSHRLTLHQNGLKITKAIITKHDKQGKADIPVARLNQHRLFNEVRLHADKLIYPGNYTVTLEFEGTITDAMNGLYPSRYGKNQVILGTQFESHHAREVFPCIDEPEAKATFDLTLTTPKDDVVLANTPVIAESENGSVKTTTFEQTPIMSTYLLAFVVGDIAHKEATTKDGVLIRAYATANNVKHVDFALDMAVKSLEFYNDYFGIPYPLPKLDMVALPDFASGAMENWGLATYREQALLVDPKNTSLPNKQYAAIVVAHELAHQWFGNLVTMRWWTDLWLNEGFASWIEYLAVDHVFPEWEIWTQFAVDNQQPALRLDALNNTHPIEVPVHHPDEIRTIFDTISYAKGASVIHMLHQHLGPTDFKKGLHLYLKKHAFKCTDTVDLWDALSEASGKDIKTFMQPWTTKPGFPIVKLDGAKLTQERFYLIKPESADHTVWPVPLLAKPAQKIDTLQAASGTADSGTLLNNGRSGFYRVAYDSQTTDYLTSQVMDGLLSPVDRFSILSDSFEIAKAGHGRTVDALKLLASFNDETHDAVWDIMHMAIGDVRSVMASDDKTRDAMKPFVRQLISKSLARLGWEPKKGEQHTDTMLRPTILGLAAFAEVPEVLDEIQARFKAMKDPEDIAPDLRSVIWNTVARFGGTKEFEVFWRLHNQSTNSEVRVTLAAALTGFKDTKLTHRALEAIKSEDVRNQDAAYWVVYALMNRFGRDTAWQWMKENWNWLEETLGTDLSFSRFPVYAARVFTGEKYLKDYGKFFEPKSSPMLERTIKQGREIIQWHTDWYNRDHAKVLKFLKKQELSQD